MNPEHKNILITGATGGIGRAITAELARRGARVHAVGRNRALLDELDREYGLSAAGGGTICADIAAPEGRAAVLAAWENPARPLDILINCAGISDFALFPEQDAALIERMIAVNVTAPMLLTRQLLAALRRAESARIINIGSTFGSIGYPGFVAYSATKFALRGFSEALRRELAGGTVRVDYIAPRATQTALNSRRVREMNRVLGISMDKPEKVAAAVLRVIRGKRGGNRFIGWPERLFVKINGIAPRLVDASLLKRLAVITRYATDRS